MGCGTVDVWYSSLSPKKIKWKTWEFSRCMLKLIRYSNQINNEDEFPRSGVFTGIGSRILHVACSNPKDIHVFVTKISNSIAFWQVVRREPFFSFHLSFNWIKFQNGVLKALIIFLNKRINLTTNALSGWMHPLLERLDSRALVFLWCKSNLYQKQVEHQVKPN